MPKTKKSKSSQNSNISDTLVLPLTKANLELLGFKEVSPAKPAKPAKPKKTRKTSTAQINKEKAFYNTRLNEFNEGEHMEVYYLLEKIAKRKYHKNEELAAFQEDFYQNFIKNKNLPGRRKFKSEDIEECDNKLKKLRAKADMAQLAK